MCTLCAHALCVLQDPGISELDPEYQAAYQRALAFAMNQGQ